MTRVLALFTLLCCLPLYGQSDIQSLLAAKGFGQNSRAIIIANEDYQSYATIYTENEDLAINQAERFGQMLIKKSGVLPQNIQFYPDAVNTNIKLAITKLQRSFPPDANLIFYYRGKIYKDGSGETYLVPVDVSDNETFYMFSLRDLCTRLSIFSKNGVIILIDALKGTKTGSYGIIQNGFTEGEVPLTTAKNMFLYNLKAPAQTAVKQEVPANASKPKIIVTEPAYKINSTNESTVIVKGRVNSDCDIEVISVNGQEAHFTQDGSFMARVAITEGENVIALEAKNCVGWTRDYVIFNLAKLTADAADVADSTLYAETSTLKEQGKNIAVIIGVSKYIDPMMPDLYYPIFDARKVNDALINNYTFDKRNVLLLLNPTKGKITGCLDSLSKIITHKDNLLIFYAGHGSWSEKTSTGYWLPADAAARALDNWLMNNIVTGYVSQCNARHTLVIADACFGGSIFRTRAIKPEEERTLSNLYLKTSKKAMTSGDLTEVPDESVFVKNFIQLLTENKEDYLSSEDLFFRIKPNVVKVADLVPQFGIIKNAGDEGGDFIFFRRKQ